MTATADDFIQRWQHANGSERANYQLFLTELCALLGLDRPDPASEDTEDNAYVFERKVGFRHADGSSSNGYIDLYRRGCFVCEAKQTNKTLDSKGWDNAMLRAHAQAQQYARALPAQEGRPPFVILVDVGRNIELYAEFTRSGATYVPYPDPRPRRRPASSLPAASPARRQRKSKNCWKPWLRSARRARTAAAMRRCELSRMVIAPVFSGRSSSLGWIACRNRFTVARMTRPTLFSVISSIFGYWCVAGVGLWLLTGLSTSSALWTWLVVVPGLGWLLTSPVGLGGLLLALLLGRG